MNALAWLWTAGALTALLGVMAWSLRTRDQRAAEIRQFMAEPILYFLVLGGVAGIAGFLLWILTNGRLFGIWTLPLSLAFGIAGYSYSNWKARRQR